MTTPNNKEYSPSVLFGYKSRAGPNLPIAESTRAADVRAPLPLFDPFSMYHARSVQKLMADKEAEAVESIKIAITHDQVGFNPKKKLPNEVLCRLCGKMALDPCVRNQLLYCAGCLCIQLNKELNSPSESKQTASAPWTDDKVARGFGSEFFARSFMFIEIVCKSCSADFTLGDPAAVDMSHCLQCPIKCYLCKEQILVSNYKAHIATCTERIFRCPWAELIIEKVPNIPATLGLPCFFFGNQRDMATHLQLMRCNVIKNAFLVGYSCGLNDNKMADPGESPLKRKRLQATTLVALGSTNPIKFPDFVTPYAQNTCGRGLTPSPVMFAGTGIPLSLV